VANSTALSAVEAEADRIHSACDEIEMTMVDVEDPEQWRIALGLIDSASLRAHKTRNQLLATARKRAAAWSAEQRSTNDNSE